jgi:predicted nuclease of restriction endonuclease-like (RecB) superfamily
MKENTFLSNKEYSEFIKTLKQNIKEARYRAIYKVNSELINLYYNIGKEIVLKQKNTNWGDDLIGQIEKDLKQEFPDMSGFSRTNLFYMKKFYLFFDESTKVPPLVGQLDYSKVPQLVGQFDTSKVQQLVAQIPWSHIRIILDKIKTQNEAIFYVQETINNNWSKVILQHQIELDLYNRKGKLVNNFDKTLSKKDIHIISQSFKDSYILDFINLSEEAKEKDLEDALVSNITSFLMELGKGFAFVGKQYKIVVGGEDFFIDLLFYNYILKRFIVIELKTTEFKPEHIGQIGFYITAIDKNIKTNTDKDTIGLLICKSKNKTIVEYALSNNKKALGVAQYFSKLPKEVLEYLPNELDLKNIVNSNYVEK